MTDNAGSANYPLNCWYVIATSDEVGRSLLAREALGRRLLLFRTEDGQAAVLDDRCPHRAAPLSMGTLDGDRVVCAYHGFTYAPDGQCVRVPSQRHVPYGARVHSYPVIERPPFVWIWPGNPARSRGTEPPDLPPLREPGWTVLGGSLEMAVNYLLLHDNALDRTHFPYVHPHRIHRGYVQDPPPLRIEVAETTVSYSRTFTPGAADRLAARRHRAARGPGVHPARDRHLRLTGPARGRDGHHRPRPGLPGRVHPRLHPGRRRPHPDHLARRPQLRPRRRVGDRR
jgi:phenylpropionate dioxygenase-like ring-hydroxylating dioxygenase large terminal subunit